MALTTSGWTPGSVLAQIGRAWSDWVTDGTTRLPSGERNRALWTQAKNTVFMMRVQIEVLTTRRGEQNPVDIGIK
jgi:hypothetical protein